jgi:hypothetical protein
MSYIQIPSVCLPRVWHKFNKNYIESIFCELFGPAADGDSCVTRIDLIPKKDRNTGEDFWVVFVHFSELMISTEFLEDFVERINANEEIKIQYNPPWFWKVRKNTGTRKEPARTGPRIMSRKDEEQLMATQKQILAERTTNQQHDDENNDYQQKVLEQAESYREKFLETSGKHLKQTASEPNLKVTIPPPPRLKRSSS